MKVNLCAYLQKFVHGPISRAKTYSGPRSGRVYAYFSGAVVRKAETSLKILFSTYKASKIADTQSLPHYVSQTKIAET